jgi:hypothetical protein
MNSDGPITFLGNDLRACSEEWSNDVISICNFVKIGQMVQKLKGTHAHTHTQSVDLISEVYFVFRKKGNQVETMSNHAYEVQKNV